LVDFARSLDVDCLLKHTDFFKQCAISREDACALDSSFRRVRFHELEQERSSRLSDKPAPVGSDAKVQHVRAFDLSCCKFSVENDRGSSFAALEFGIWTFAGKMI
jgi:hypothetical protein